VGSHARGAGSIYSGGPGADNSALPYASRFERFECRAADGSSIAVEFLRAGTLTAGDRPELYFFRHGGEEVVVGLSGAALDAVQQARRFSREEKIDVAGLHLQRQIEAGRPLDSTALFVRGEELQGLLQELGFELARRS